MGIRESLTGYTVVRQTYVVLQRGPETTIDLLYVSLLFYYNPEFSRTSCISHRHLGSTRRQ